MMMFSLVPKRNLKVEKVKQAEFNDYKRTVSETIYGDVLSCDNTKDFLQAIDQKFRESDEAEINNLLNCFTTACYIIRVVWSNIQKIVQIDSRVREVVLQQMILSYIVLLDYLSLE